jgi:two-component system, cell cycle sensor histidine kinase and response regulator CckA
VIQSLRAGVRDFVTKSVEYLDYLPEAVRRVLHQVRTERRLAESEAQLAAVIGSAKDAIILADSDHKITLFNAAAEKMFRCPSARALGQQVSVFIPPEYHQAPGESFFQQVRQGTRGVRADGEEFPLEASVSRAESEGRRFYSIVARDITERVRLAEQLRQSQKMEAIGTLTGGIAHDFNNLLTVISGYTEMLLQRAGPDDPSYDLLRQVHRAGGRAADLTRQMLAFSRKQVLQPVLLDLNVLVAELGKLLRRVIGEDITLTTTLAPDLARVKADPGQMEQILMNLMVNARDAMPQGGSLTVETRNVELDATYAARQPEIQPGRYVLLAVSDTGVGMSEEVKARIFEPFFTTKPVGKGTGLGLSTVYGIVKQSGGQIEVYSEPGHGTAFKVYLPRAAGTTSAAPTGAAVQTPRGAETVLLAEDENSVREITRLVLQSQGYTVLDAGDGGKALELCRSHPGPIHLLATDVVMPQMSGRQLAEAVAGLRPGVRILYLSGYADDAVVRHGVLETGVAFLQKPFTPLTLARKVREVLDDPGVGLGAAPPGRPAAPSGGG